MEGQKKPTKTQKTQVVLQKPKITQKNHDNDKDNDSDNKKENHKKDIVIRIFEYWKKIHNHGKSKLDSKRSKLISDRIKEGYSEEDLKTAIDGCKKSTYHMGENETSTIYDSISLIFRNADKVDQFMKYCDCPRKQPQTYHSSEQQTLDELNAKLS